MPYALYYETLDFFQFLTIGENWLAMKSSLAIFRSLFYATGILYDVDEMETFHKAEPFLRS
jgi:hypothetical protein